MDEPARPEPPRQPGPETDPAAGLAAVCHQPAPLNLTDELATLQALATAEQARRAAVLAMVHHERQADADNLAHYLALRRLDLRRLQAELAARGLSSLGRSEADVMAALRAVQNALLPQAAVAQPPAGPVPAAIPPADGAQRLRRHAQALFGPPSAGRDTRIMVTLPATAAEDANLVRQLLAQGMDIARINCAHDDPATWRAMARQVRETAQASGHAVRILMDLGGPKLRTGPIAAGPPVLRLKPQRDSAGQTVAPARLWLHATGEATAAHDGPQAGVAPEWLRQLRMGDRIDCADLRSLQRQLNVAQVAEHGALLTSTQTIYLGDQTRLQLHRKRHQGPTTALSDLPPPRARIRLQPGDMLLLTADGVGGPARDDQAASVPVQLPAALRHIHAGEPVWFDDGRIGALARRPVGSGWLLEITDAPADGAWLGEDKGINLPETPLDLPALSDADREALPTVLALADLLGLSFVQQPADIDAVRQACEAAGGPVPPLVLKIETRRGFAQLPGLLLHGLQAPALGVMIARGDLAVECGWERLAEVQEEILWACEAARVPVIWATQVLETLTATGRPTRAEITDAASGERAECVMLNKGPHLVAAVRMLDGILRRMQEHQTKKRSLLRALKSW